MGVDEKPPRGQRVYEAKGGAVLRFWKACRFLLAGAVGKVALETVAEVRGQAQSILSFTQVVSDSDVIGNSKAVFMFTQKWNGEEVVGALH